ncbi:GD25404 [Drosophila simulans]|uniref:GD25404 n=1 Tax=Drosophila simulans TaxID=7240 RepID=B4QCB3_DROSI|nr:GD25404 [Drosophila simulans]
MSRELVVRSPECEARTSSPNNLSIKIARARLCATWLRSRTPTPAPTRSPTLAESLVTMFSPFIANLQRRQAQPKNRNSNELAVEREHERDM